MVLLFGKAKWKRHGNNINWETDSVCILPGNIIRIWLQCLLFTTITASRLPFLCISCGLCFKETPSTGPTWEVIWVVTSSVRPVCILANNKYWLIFKSLRNYYKNWKQFPNSLWELNQSWFESWLSYLICVSQNGFQLRKNLRRWFHEMVVQLFDSFCRTAATTFNSCVLLQETW